MVSLGFPNFIDCWLQSYFHKDAVDQVYIPSFQVIRRIKNGLELKAKVATESFVDVKLSLNKGMNRV